MAGLPVEFPRGALVPFLTAGYPSPAAFRAAAAAAVAAGADVLEVGAPFSDPIADGPVIQAAGQVALAGGMTLGRVLEEARRYIVPLGAPVVLMGYWNPVRAYGVDRFAQAAARAGVAGLIAADLPVEESGGLRQALDARGVALISLLAPTSDSRRVRRTAGVSRGFVYLVSTTGVTGERRRLATGLEAFVGRVRRETTLPLYVGFGVSRPDQAARVAAVADGVIVGSALLAHIAGTSAREAARRTGRFVASFRRAVDRATAGESRVR